MHETLLRSSWEGTGRYLLGTVGALKFVTVPDYKILRILKIGK